MFKWLKEFLFGRKLSHEEWLWYSFHQHRKLCLMAGMNPKNVENFWKGIEEIRDWRSINENLPK